MLVDDSLHKEFPELGTMGMVSSVAVGAAKDGRVVPELELPAKGIIEKTGSEEATVMTTGRAVAFASGTPPSCSLHATA